MGKSSLLGVPQHALEYIEQVIKSNENLFSTLYLHPKHSFPQAEGKEVSKKKLEGYLVQALKH